MMSANSFLLHGSVRLVSILEFLESFCQKVGSWTISKFLCLSPNSFLISLSNCMRDDLFSFVLPFQFSKFLLAAWPGSWLLALLVNLITLNFLLLFRASRPDSLMILKLLVEEIAPAIILAALTWALSNLFKAESPDAWAQIGKAYP